jgi:outer membrane protein
MKRLSLVFALIIITTQLFSQEIWSLEKCIEYALSNNLQLKQQDLYLQGANDNLAQSKLNVLPTVNGFAMHEYNYGQTIDRYTNQFASSRVQSDNFYLSSSFTLFNGFQKINTIKQNKIDLETAHYETDKYMDDMSLNIATAYLQILYYKELLKIAEKQVEATGLQASRLKKLVDAGALAQGDYYNVQAQLASENVQVVDAQNNLELSYLTLAQMLDLPSADGFEIESPDLEIDANPSLVALPEQIYSFALENQPSIKSAEAKLRSSEVGVDLAKSSYYPTLTLSGSLGTGYSGAAQIIDSAALGNPQYIPVGFTMKDGLPDQFVYSEYTLPVYKVKPFSDQISDNINKSIAFNLNVPIFNGGQARKAVSQAKLNYENTKLNYEISKLDLQKIIQQAYANAHASLNKYESAQLGVKAAEESFRYADEKFTWGKINSVDYNNAKKDFEKAESQLLQSKYDYIFKSSVLDFYMGKPITLKRK